MTSRRDDDDVVTEVDPLIVRARGRVGQVVKEKWRLDELLGIGATAAVYAATHRNGSRVAIKMLHPELSLSPDVRSRFLREGYVANSVGHDGAVRVIDDDAAEDGSLFLVTELLYGETLEDRRVRFGGKLPEDEVLSLTDQLLDVLVAAHAKGIVHRDIKPENVFLTRAGVVKVLDFGIARLRELSRASTATRSGASMGTPAYMAPEQARALWDQVDARSDLWAVGATMFHLLSGRMVHEGRTANEVLLDAMTKPPPPIAKVAPNVTPAVSHLVDKALAFEPENRWSEARRMQEALRRAASDRTLPTAESAPPPRRPIAAIVLGGAAAIGVTVTGVAMVVALTKGGSSQAATPSASAPGTAAVESAPSSPPPAAPPEVSATDLPNAAATGAPAHAPPPPPAATTRPAPKTDCTPPYTVDSNGHKHWKVQCL